MTDQPTKLRIDRLLRNSVQPFDNLPDEKLRALAEGIRKGRALDVPVAITGEFPDPILLDGHQRLRILQEQGAVWLLARDWRVIDGVNRANTMEKAIALNDRRRHLSAMDKARVAARLQADYGWTQKRIAKAFDVSQPAVSQWFALLDLTDDGTVRPDRVIGSDGKSYPARGSTRDDDPGKRAVPRHVPDAWDGDGWATRSVRKALADLAKAPPPSTPQATARAADLMTQLVDAAEHALDSFGAEEVAR